MSSEIVDEKLPGEILSKLASFREFDKFCDVILEGDSSSNDKSEPTSSTSVRAHKLVLAAASPYFRETLSNDCCTKQTTTNKIRIVVDDIDGKTLRVLVDYMYTGRLDIDEKNVKALFGAAEILELDSVRSECTSYLIGHLGLSNWMETAAFAKTHNCTKLDDAAVLFARQHFGVLMGARLPLMSREFLLDRVYNEPMIRESAACKEMLGTVFHDMLSENKTSRVPENWYRPRQTPQKKACHTCRGTPRKIMIAGGKPDGDSRLAGVNIYDPHSQQWTTAAPLLEPRGGFGMATAGDSIYAVGGRGTSFALRSVEIYDSQSGIIFAVGGSADSQASCEAEMLDPRQGEWISLPSMMNGRYDFGLAAANGLIYAAGGNSGNQILNSVEVYDPRACRWTIAQPMLKKRRQAGVTVFRDHVVVVGGSDEEYTALSSAEILTDNGWTFLPEMSQPRQNLGVVNVDGSLFAFGGRNDEGYLSCVEYLDFYSSQWKISQAGPDAAKECLLRNHSLAMSRILWNHPI
ncbi:hypothetical protein Q1695_011344 [Nippostrongylus brasiliensis]|nr:hypothetical protein Q1695_011344 [Nippostrongylus brasiliensis]